MMDENKVRNTDVIGFIGYRTPETSLGDHSLCSLYNETINIQTLSGYVSASAIYNDNGNGFMSEQPFIEYAISAASGEFNGSKILTIFFDNVKKTRVVKIFS